MDLNELKAMARKIAPSDDPGDIVDAVFSVLSGVTQCDQPVDIPGFGTFYRGAGGGLNFMATVLSGRVDGKGKHPCKTCDVVCEGERDYRKHPLCSKCRLPKAYVAAIEERGVVSGEGSRFHRPGACRHTVREGRIAREGLGAA